MKKSVGAIILTVLKVIASLILSFLFVIIAFAFPIYCAAAGMIKPSNVVSVVQNIDYVEILQQSEEFNNTIKELGIDKSTANEIIKSKEVGGMLESCVETISSVMIDENSSIEDFDPMVLRDIANEHIDDIATVLQKELNKPIKTEELRDSINKMFDENSDAIKQTLIDVAPQTEAYSDIARMIQKSVSWPVILVVSLIEVLFLGLIYLMFMKKQVGFIWIAVDSFIVLTLISSVAIVFKSGLVDKAISMMPSFVAGVAVSAVSVVVSKLIVAIIVLAVIIAASITAFVLLRKAASRKAVAVVGEAAESEKAEEAQETEAAEKIEEVEKTEEVGQEKTEEN